jgi:pimeloyl-ACP methyl ester carboxylesterase
MPSFGPAPGSAFLSCRNVRPIVLIHGGGFDSRCWDLLVPHLVGPVLAVDLPGRGHHPAPSAEVTLAGCAASVVDDVDEAGFDDIVLVGHSLAGCSMPATIGRLGDRVRHAVFVACTVPEDGTSSLDTLEPEIQAMARAAIEGEGSGVLDSAMAKAMFGNDLDDEQFAWCVERMVPEAPTLTVAPVDLAPLRRPFPRTWVRTLHDAIVAPDKQLRFARNVGDCPVLDLDAAHMAMISRPSELARMLNGIAAAERD